MKFSIKDLIWFTSLCGVCLGWYSSWRSLDHAVKVQSLTIRRLDYELMVYKERHYQLIKFQVKEEYDGQN